MAHRTIAEIDEDIRARQANRMAMEPPHMNGDGRGSPDHGDAYEGDLPDQAPPARKEVKPRWPDPVAVSDLPDHGPAVDWIWNGCIARGHVTLFSALMKSGKTTLVSHLLRCL